MLEIGLEAIDVTSRIVSQQSSSSPDSEIFAVTLYPNSEVLIISPSEVKWVKNDILVRKFRYDNPEDKIVNAHIVYFNNSLDSLTRDPATKRLENNERKKTLAVVLADRAHIYFEDNEPFIISFPDKIRKSLSFENGLILERQHSTNQETKFPLFASSIAPGPNGINNSKVNFFTLLGPLHELGMVVSSSTSSFSPNEELIWFPSSLKSTLTVTYNSSNHIIAIYHVRYLTRNKAMTAAKRSSIRKRSISRKSSIPNSAVIGTPVSETATEELTINRAIQARRSLSHSELRPFDRVPSGSDVSGVDFNDAGNVSIGNIPSASIDTTVFRKDMVLTKIEKVQFNFGQNNLKVFSISFHNKQGVVIVNKESKDTEVLIFKSSNNSVSLPSYQTSFNLKCSDAIPLSTESEQHEGYLAVLDENNFSVRLVNPFIGLFSRSFNLGNKYTSIQSLDDCCKSHIVITVSGNKKRQVKLLLEPKEELINKCLQAFRHIFGPYIYEYVWLKWCAALGIAKNNEWESFVVTLLSILIPNGTDFAQIDASNCIVNQLAQASTLNQSVDLQLHVKFEKSLNDLAPNAMLALHLIREELKLNILEKELNHRFDLLLAQLASWMGWSDEWISYYMDDSLLLDLKTRFPTLEPLENPPNLLKSICSIFTNQITPYISFSQLSEENDAIDEAITPRTYYVLRIFEAIVSPQFSPADVVNLMVEYNIDSYDLDTYPIGISLPLKEYLSYYKNGITVGSSIDSINLLGRKDLERMLNNEKLVKKSISFNTSATKDTHHIIQSIKNDEPLNAWDSNIESKRLEITKLIFSVDRRYYEITKLLQSSKVQTVTLRDALGLNEYDLLNLQKELSILISLRTLTIPLGRGALFLSSRMPILTDKFPIPKLNFDTLIKPGNTTLTLDKELIDPEIMNWGYFHNGASAGLTILRNAKNIVGSWIVFNKPNSLNSQHGGFLLGLGLNGHLKNLEEWHIYNYLNPKHTHTSVGLLLGMSASAKRSMNVTLTKVLSVHLVALLPQAAADLNVSLPVQTAGLVGIGLLYLETQNRRMSEILLSQISNKLSLNDRLVVDEGYRLAAGIALGYVNLGKGNDLKGLSDTHLTDTLLSMAVSLKDVQASQEFDKSAPGAILAVGFIYIRTNNHNIASKLAVPETEKLLDYIRSDLLLLRIIAKNLILWGDISCTLSWIESQIPECLLKKYTIENIKTLDSDQLSYLNCLGGACVSIGLKYASTGNLTARDNILFYLDQFMRITILPYSTFDEEITQSSAAVIQHVLALSAALVMAGTGDLEVFRRLRSLHNRTSQNMTFSDYSSLSMALGFLFIGSGEYAFDDTNFALAALVTSIYPAPVEDTDSPIYLQALRHFWALSVIPRCLVVRDVVTLKPVEIPIELVLKNGRHLSLKAPCLIPKLDDILSIRTLSRKHFEVSLNFDQQDLREASEMSASHNVYENFKKNLTIYVFEREESERVDKNTFSSIIKTFANDFNQIKTSTMDKICDLILEDEYNINEHQLSHNILVADARLEARNLVKLPDDVDDLWNIKLLFAFYDKITDIKTHYLSAELVKSLKIDLWRFSQGLQ